MGTLVVLFFSLTAFFIENSMLQDSTINQFLIFLGVSMFIYNIRTTTALTQE